MEWESPGIVLDVRPFGEGDGVASVLTETHGRHRGLARGAARRNAALWQPGNVVQVRWVGRLADQLGNFSAEMVHPAAALAMDDALTLAMLTAACAVADGALPERGAHPGLFAGLLQFIAHLALGEEQLAGLVRWEAALLAELGYGMDLASCAVSGAREGLGWVSPRTGRAVSDAAAGTWKPRLLKLPEFLLGQGPAGAADWRDGLALTGHFLARDVFGLQHRALPPARLALYDRVCALAESDAHHVSGPTPP
jgi:DNA repair protein RecO (recombination protein O)